MRCCNGDHPAHPSTGHWLSGEMWLCGPCAGRFFAWVVQYTRGKNKRRGGVSFYDAAVTSIRPE